MTESYFLTDLVDDKDFQEIRLLVGTSASKWQFNNETHFAWVPWKGPDDDNDLGYMFIKNNGFQFNFRPTQQTLLYKIELPIQYEEHESNGGKFWLLRLNLTWVYSSSSNDRWTQILATDPIFNFPISMNEAAFNYFRKWCRKLETITPT